jgi:hypothetical protein
MTNTEFLAAKIDRGYIKWLRTDPRVRRIFEGFVARATMEADLEVPHIRDVHEARQLAHVAARLAVQMVMDFVIDNDGEYQMVKEERDQLQERLFKLAELAPNHMAMNMAPYYDREGYRHSVAPHPPQSAPDKSA